MKNRSFTKFVNMFPNNPSNSRYRRGLKDVKTGMQSDFSRRREEFEKSFERDNKFSRGLKDD